MKGHKAILPLSLQKEYVRIIQSYNRTGMVKEICKEPRSHFVHSEAKLYRRNGTHILPVAESAPSQLPSVIDYQDAGVN